MIRLVTSATVTVLVLLFSNSVFAQLQEPSPPINLIIDSDMAIDADDVGDHAMMWGLVNRGEAKVLALIASSANDYSAPCMRAVANYYGHPEVPVGANKASTPNINSSATSRFAQQITNQFGTPGDTRFNYPDAVTVYRQALATAPDNSVYIVANGYFEPLQGLLQSQPDAISPLTGMQLVAQKVRRLVPSGGWFPAGTENNFMNDPDAASYVFANWPGEIVSVGANVGGDVITGPSPNSDPAQDPVEDAYLLFGSQSNGAWGQAALLYGVRGGIGTNFSIGGYNGDTVVQDSTQSPPGQNYWYPTPNLGRSWLQKAISATDMAAIINPLLQSSSNMPILRSISPTNIAAGTPGQSVTLTGTNFFSDSQVSINGNSRPTTFVSGTQLTVQLSSGDLVQVSTPPLTVSNSSEGNWKSNPINLNVYASTPTLSSITPTSAVRGGAPTTLTVNGSSFITTSVVQVNGTPRNTTFVNGSQMTATLSANDLATEGILSISVATPSGGTSAPLNFTVNNPQPSLAAISPAAVSAGSAAFTMTLNGANFVSDSVVQVNGSSRNTTFVSTNQLTASIPASDVAKGAYLSITVSSPAPGGGVTGAITLTVNNPVPAISSISPNPLVAAGASSTLTVTGSGFVQGSVVKIDGSPIPTTVMSPTQLQAQISNNDLVRVGQHSVTVFNSLPGGGTSNSATLTVAMLLGDNFGPGADLAIIVMDAQSEPFMSVAV